MGHVDTIVLNDLAEVGSSWPLSRGCATLSYIGLSLSSILIHLSDTDHGDSTYMKLTPWFLAALAPFGAIAYSGYLGHALVVMVTVGIFLGTLSLNKSAVEPQKR